MLNRRLFQYKTVVAAFLCVLSQSAARADECPLAGPSQLISARAPGIKSHAFTMTSERESTETVVLAGGAKLQLSVKGCEYFVLAVRYESMGSRLNPEDSRGAYLAAAEALAALSLAKPDTFFNLPLAARELRNIAARKSKPERGVEIPIPMAMEPVPSLTVERWGSISNQSRFVELHLAWGPA
jgi:hypothetical protein